MAPCSAFLKRRRSSASVLFPRASQVPSRRPVPGALFRWRRLQRSVMELAPSNEAQQRVCMQIQPV